MPNKEPALVLDIEDYHMKWLTKLWSDFTAAAAAAAKSLQLCPTLCDPIDGSPPGSPFPGILQARTLEWVAISSPMHESEKWKWSCSVVSDSLRLHGLQPTRLLHPWDFPGKSTGVGCDCLRCLLCSPTQFQAQVSTPCLTSCNSHSSLIIPLTDEGKETQRN